MNTTRHAPSDEPPSGPPPLYSLVYCSRAAAGINESMIARIIESSRRRNAIHGITGLLVFGSGIFFQWLEGPRDTVTRLMATLRADPRHEDVVTLAESEEVRERLFPDWDMERVSAADIRDVLLDALSDAGDSKSADVLRTLLEQLESGQLCSLLAAS